MRFDIQSIEIASKRVEIARYKNNVLVTEIFEPPPKFWADLRKISSNAMKFGAPTHIVLAQGKPTKMSLVIREQEDLSGDVIHLLAQYIPVLTQ